jgi:hypothetical protein
VKWVRLSRFQRGYLYEIPVVLLALFLALALILPGLSVFGRKVLLGVTIFPILYCLFYVIVRPGRTAARNQGGHAYGRLAFFLACAIAAIVLVALFVHRKCSRVAMQGPDPLAELGLRWECARKRIDDFA